MNRLPMILTLLLCLALAGCDDDDPSTGSDTDAGPSMMAATDAGPGMMATGSASWGEHCDSDADCGADGTDFCVINPMTPDMGYCSTACATTSDCGGSGDLGYTCNAVGDCASPLAIWCGPPSELEAGGPLNECM